MTRFYFRYIWLPAALTRLYLRRLRRAILFRSHPFKVVSAWTAVITSSYLGGNLYGGYQYQTVAARTAPEAQTPATVTRAAALPEPKEKKEEPKPAPVPAPAPPPAPEEARAAEPVPPPPTPAPRPPVVRAASTGDTYPNTYVYGHCTYYVASRRDVPSNWGHANTWLYRARAAGYRTGSSPTVGAIAWTSAGYYGHVAYVEQVGANGMVYISEMNYAGNWNVRTERWVPATDFLYIY